jgi:hypothetical protein
LGGGDWVLHGILNVARRVGPKVTHWAIIAFLLISGAGGLYYQIKQNAVLKERAAATEKALINYSDSVNDEIARYNTELEQQEQDKQVLRQLYISTALKLEDEKEAIDSHDYEKLARKKPRILERVINNAIDGMHSEFENIIGATADAGHNQESGQAATDETVTSKDKSRNP